MPMRRSHLVVYGTPGSNALQLSDDVRATMARLKANFPKGVDYNIVYDPTRFVQTSIGTLLVAGTPSYFRDTLQLVHPEWESLEEGQEVKGSILSRYPLTMEMSEARVEHRFLQRAALEALEKFTFSDPLEETHRRELGLAAEVDLLTLKAAKLVDQHVKNVKVIKSGELKKAVKLTGIGATAGAKAAIEAAGGSLA